MYLSSKLTTTRAVGVALVVTLLALGVPALQAKHHDEGVAQTSQCCSAPVVREEPAPPPQTCCPAPVLEKPTPPQAVTCCPVDPKEVKKAQRAAEHAQHEAAEACRRQQKEVAKAQARIDKAQAKAEHEVAEANAKLEKRQAEWQEANDQVPGLSTSPTQSGAE
jgi:septin family protein